MTFHEQIGSVPGETLAALGRFRPELALCGTIVGLLLLRIVFGRRASAGLLTLIGTAIGLVFAIQDTWLICCSGQTIRPEELFGGMLIFDGFTAFFRTFLLAFTAMFVLVTWCTGIPDREDGPDIYTMALGAVVGMCLMASANHLLMIFLGIEIASVPSYALAGLLKGRKESSEAALKFAVYGAGAAGIMLYGISLFAGIAGTVHLPSMFHRISEVLIDSARHENLAGTQMVLALAGLMLMVGLAFKLSAVPFHFWAPDVFEGAAAEIGGFLSVASKGAAIALLVRVVVGFGSGPPEGAVATPRPTMSAHTSVSSTPITAVALSAPSAAPSAKASPSTSTWTTLDKGQAQQSIRRYIVYLVAFLAAITATFGNLAAYGQTNIKRLLAYSTIAHAGYMMMPVAAVLLLPAENAGIAVGSVAFYVAMYLFMNLGAFTIVALLRNQIRSERIDDYAGLYQHSPGLVICFSIILFSLVGLPPLAGFAAKFVIFSAVIDAGMYLLLTIGVLNSVLSLFYYVKVMKVMIMTPPRAGQPETHLPLLSFGGLCVLALSLPVLAFGVYPNPIIEWAQQSAMSLFRVIP